MKEVITPDDQFDLVYILTTVFPSIHVYTFNAFIFKVFSFHGTF